MKPSRNLLKLGLAATIFVTSVAQADPGGGLNKDSIFSIVYSSSSARALVGGMENQNVAAFWDCEAPRGEPEAKLAVNDLANCKIISSSRFFYTEEQAQKINDAFPNVLNELYSRAYRADVASANFANEFVFILMDIAAVGATVGLASYTNSALRAGRFIRAAGGAGGTAGLIALLGGMLVATYYVDQNASGHATVRSLDAQMVERWQSVLKKHPELAGVNFEQKYSVLGYDLLRDAILQSIARASST